jgi:hypothetical protein
MITEYDAFAKIYDRRARGAGHWVEFAEATTTESGHQALLNAAKAMAMTVIDLIVDPALLEAAREEHGLAE